MFSLSQRSDLLASSSSSLNLLPCVSISQDSSTWLSTGNRSGPLLLVLVMMWVLVLAPSPLPLGITRHHLPDLVCLSTTPGETRHDTTRAWTDSMLSRRRKLDESTRGTRRFLVPIPGYVPTPILVRPHVDTVTFTCTTLSHRGLSPKLQSTCNHAN